MPRASKTKKLASKPASKPVSKPSKIRTALTAPTPSSSSSSLSSSSEPIYFYGRANPFGEFSQHYQCTFTSSSRAYTSSEQFMMHHKALLFAPESSYPTQILCTSDPMSCKALGRAVPGFEQAVWEQHRERIVEQANYEKFTQDAELKALLLGTGERELVEAAPRDRIWGIGFGHEKARVVGRERWGRNLLGACLERVRTRIREEEKKGKMAGETVVVEG